MIATDSRLAGYWLARPTTRRRRLAGRRRLLHVAAALGLVVGVTQPAHAQFTVYDPANYAENVLHYLNQLTQIKDQLDQIRYQLQALAKLPTTAWRDVTAPIGAATQVMSAAQSLGYAARNAPQTFAQQFAPARIIQRWPAEEAAQAQSTVSVMQAAVAATADQAAAVSPGLSVIERMKALNGTVEGHEQALELQNTAAVYSAEELMLLRQATMTQTNIQAVYYANQLDAEAQRDASIRAGLAAMAVPGDPQPLESLAVGP